MGGGTDAIPESRPHRHRVGRRRGVGLIDAGHRPGAVYKLHCDVCGYEVIEATREKMRQMGTFKPDG